MDPWLICLVVWMVATTVSCLALSRSLVIASKRIERLERGLFCSLHQAHHGSCLTTWLPAVPLGSLTGEQVAQLDRLSNGRFSLLAMVPFLRKRGG